MFTISYNISASLKSKLAKIDNLYQTILLIPTSPGTESQLRRLSTLAHIEGWANLANQPLSKNHVEDILTKFQAKNSSDLVTKVLAYKNALNYVYQHWSANPSPVDFNAISQLAQILRVQTGSQEGIESLLAYLQNGPMHPVIQSAIIQLVFYPSRLAHLASLLFLARFGYHLRGYLNLEDYWYQNKSDYLQFIQKASKSQNASIWLDFFAQAIIIQMSAVQEYLISPPSPSHQYALKKLAGRQKTILTYLEKPGSTIANKQVQALFGISQVTASRDLAALSISGLLAPHGSGRSTSYTKL